ncbi:hypothetical protein C4D60_Mb11t20790 [Musa balbisiana]|uniref:Tetraspanin family protein n=1 Tax=Musa balbisiana TaxID=52838 RepID=A0A4S8J5L3_MUSBA|nr:hypothetical protein C4D60_Mb11t20790 [Musa balbisiana]
MAFRRLWECLLNPLNFLLTLTGLAMMGYGVYLLVEWNTASSAGNDPVSPTSGHPEFSKFIYLFIGVGVTLFVISCFGCIAAVTRNGCCLSFYSFLVTLLIRVELGAAAFILFDHSWKDYIPADVTGNFDMIYDFFGASLEDSKMGSTWCCCFGAPTIKVLTRHGINAYPQALVFLLAEYDSDDEYIAPRYGMWEPLIIGQGIPATGEPVHSALDQHPSSTVAYIQRLREKYGLDSSMFTYNSSGPGISASHGSSC